MNKIAILIPTILKDDILMETLNSIIDNWSDDFGVLIGDQNDMSNYSEEKILFYKSACAFAHTMMPGDCFKVVQLPFDCGLSYARNKLVEIAHGLGIKYCVISADSIKFTESMKQLGELTRLLNTIDLLGFELKNRIGWEAKLDLKDSFILDFIKKTEEDNVYYDCDIVRNFFLATTESLLKVKWDDTLKMAEHEDFFWRYKKAGYKVGWTDCCEGEYVPCVKNDYKQLRNKNMRMGKELVKKKWGLTSMVKYIHLERIKKG